MSYNKSWMDGENIRAVSKKLMNNKLINEVQFKQIEEQHKEHFYSPNLFVRIGLFIFTFILANSVLGIFGMTFAAAFNDEMAFGILCFIAAAALFFTLKFFIKTKHHFRSGIDDCLLYMALFFVIAGFTLFTDFGNPKLILVLSLPVLAFGAYIYHDRFVAILAFLCLLMLVFLTAADYSIGKLILPFLFCIIASVVTVSAHRMLLNDRFIYWDHVLKALKIVGLVIVYLSMNYFVVREGNILLQESTLETPSTPEYKALQLKIEKNQEVINNSYSDSTLTLSETELAALEDENTKLYEEMYIIERAELDALHAKSLPMGWIFIILTIFFPVLYIYYGLAKKDRTVLLTGLGILAFTVFTYKYYVHLFPIEYTITISGIIVLVIAWVSIKYLKSNSGKFTYEPDSDDDNQGLLNAEAFIASQTSLQGADQPVQGNNYGGGSFGGGGAGGNY